MFKQGFFFHFKFLNTNVNPFCFIQIHTCVFSFTFICNCVMSHSLSDLWHVELIFTSYKMNFSMIWILDCDLFLMSKCVESFSGLSGCNLTFITSQYKKLPDSFRHFVLYKSCFNCELVIPSKLWHLRLELLFMSGTVTAERLPLLDVTVCTLGICY